MDDTPLPNPRDRLLGGALVVAPLLLLASTIAHSTGDGLGEDLTGGALQVWAAIAFGLAIVGLTARLATRLPRASALLSLTGMMAVAGAVAFGIDSMVFSIDPAAALSEADGDARIGLALFLPGLTLPFTLAGLGLAIVRTGVAPKVPGALLVAGAVCFPVSRIGGIEALAVVADLLLAAGMVPLGLATLRQGVTDAAPRLRSTQAVSA